jgi:hypothetical protein
MASIGLLPSYTWQICYNGAGYVLDTEYLLIDTTDATEQMDGLMNVIEKLHSDDINKQVKAMDQHANIRLKQGVWACSLVQAAAKTMPAYKWWMQFGGSAPELQHLAIRVLGQVSSACSCERNWSTYDFMHSKKRNRLLPDRARDLVFVFINLHLVDKVEAAEYCDTVIEWQERSSSSSEEDE